MPALPNPLGTPQPDAILSAEPLRTPWQTQNPFLFCMHHNDAYPAGNAQFGPIDSLRGRQIGQDFANKDGWNMYHGQQVPGFPQHPHRGFETVTVVRKGLLDHSDSLGAAARYGQGDVQWLTAGQGIQHAEMFPLLRSDAPNPVELFQIWLNLPRASKMVAPYFSMFWADTIPRQRLEDQQGKSIEISVIAGSIGDLVGPEPPPNSWAHQAGSDVAIWTLKLQAGAQWTLPAAQPGSNRVIYFFEGKELTIGPRTVAVRQAIAVRPEAALQLTAGSQDVELLVLQGKPIAEPVVQYGPFVMNTQAEIQQTFADYQRTGFGGWPWPRVDPVHGPEQQRLARYPDGRIDKPA